MFAETAHSEVCAINVIWRNPQRLLTLPFKHGAGGMDAPLVVRLGKAGNSPDFCERSVKNVMHQNDPSLWRPNEIAAGACAPTANTMHDQRRRNISAYCRAKGRFNQTSGSPLRPIALFGFQVAGVRLELTIPRRGTMSPTSYRTAPPRGPPATRPTSTSSRFRHLPLSAAVQKLFRHVPKVRRFRQFAILLKPVLNAFPVD